MGWLGHKAWVNLICLAIAEMELPISFEAETNEL